jgi:hypothetical protein
MTAAILDGPVNSTPPMYDCAWCGKRFVPRLDGGHTQRFCSPICRRGLDAAGRRYVVEALERGVLSIEALRDGCPATRALPRCVETLSVVP